MSHLMPHKIGDPKLSHGSMDLSTLQTDGSIYTTVQLSMDRTHSQQDEDAQMQPESPLRYRITNHLTYPIQFFCTPYAYSF